MGLFDDIILEEKPKKPEQGASSGLFDDILSKTTTKQEEKLRDASDVKREYVEQGGRPEDVYSPERAKILIEQGPEVHSNTASRENLHCI